MFTIYNLPANFTNYAFITAREVDGDFWFYGAWNDRNGANEQALSIGGIMLETSMVKRA